MSNNSLPQTDPASQPLSIKPGDKVQGTYFGIPFVGVVTRRLGGNIVRECYTIIRCTPPIHTNYGTRNEIGIYDYQLERPNLKCSLITEVDFYAGWEAK